ncbi:MAG: branched-chain amino acid ABC transporter permease [Deltaproteobacteria bacterium]|nr:branched-chain amino acid ABC transporter permease [Deltaproteobacteria bacterium]
MRRNAAKWIGFMALGAFLIVLPYMISEYRLNLVITMLVYSLFAVSYNMLFGQGGLLSFGHAAYFGAGAYVNMILLKQLNVSLPLGILSGRVMGGLLRLIFGIFVVRMRGVPFALLTLAFNQLIYVTAEKWRSVTGGEDGLAATRPNLVVGGLELDLFKTVNWYYFALFVVAAGIFICWHFTRTPLGRLNICMRENEERTRFIGYNTYATRLFIYIISSFFAGIAGALASSFQEFVTTTFINLDKAAEILMMTFIGGGGTFAGPIVGACALTYINDVLSTWTERWALVQGTLFILLVLYAPNGLSGLYLSFKARYLKKTGGATG